MILVIPITKEEAMFLREHRAQRYISRPTRNKKYFMAEEPAALRLLELCRNSGKQEVRHERSA